MKRNISHDDIELLFLIEKKEKYLNLLSFSVDKYIIPLIKTIKKTIVNVKTIIVENIIILEILLVNTHNNISIKKDIMK
jgi:hypothetical protein